MVKRRDRFDWYEFACDWALIVVLLVITVKSCTHLYLIRETIHESKVEQLAE